MSRISGFIKQATIVCTMLVSFSASAQRYDQSCNEQRGQYSSQTRCERYEDSCSYDQRSGCYIADREDRPICEERRERYESKSRCERFHDYCSFDGRSGCYLPDREERPRCNEKRNEFDSENACLRENEYCEYNRQTQCYEPAVPERKCNAKYNEYTRESECKSDHSQGCNYRSDIKCYVPNEKPKDPEPAICPWTDDDGSYEGRGRRGFRNQEICEISEGRRSGVCEKRNDGCWHPRGR